MNKQCGNRDLDVLSCMDVTLDTSHSPIAPSNDDAHAEPSPELPTHEFTAVCKALRSAGVNTACTTPTINTVAANKNHTRKVHERRPPVRVLPRLGPPLCPRATGKRDPTASNRWSREAFFVGQRGSSTGVAQVSRGKSCADAKAIGPLST